MKTFSIYKSISGEFGSPIKKVLTITADPFEWDGDAEAMQTVRQIMGIHGLFLTKYDDLQRLPEILLGTDYRVMADPVLVKATWDESLHPRSGKFTGKSAGEAHAALTGENKGHTDKLKAHLQQEGAVEGHDWGHVGNQEHIAHQLDNLKFSGKKKIPPQKAGINAEDRHRELIAHNVGQLDALNAHTAQVAQHPNPDWGHVGDAGDINSTLSDLNDFARGEGQYASASKPSAAPASAAPTMPKKGMKRYGASKPAGATAAPFTADQKDDPVSAQQEADYQAGYAAEQDRQQGKPSARVSDRVAEFNDRMAAGGGPDIEGGKERGKDPSRESREAKEDQKAYDDQAYQPVPKSAAPKAAAVPPAPAAPHDRDSAVRAMRFTSKFLYGRARVHGGGPDGDYITIPNSNQKLNLTPRDGGGYVMTYTEDDKQIGPAFATKRNDQDQAVAAYDRHMRSNLSAGKYRTAAAPAVPPKKG